MNEKTDYTAIEKRSYARRMNELAARRRAVAQCILPFELFPSFASCGCACDESFRRANSLTLSVSAGGIAHVRESCCNGSLICPVCAPRRLFRMADELEEVITSALDAGLSVYMVTHTVPHSTDDWLDPLVDGLTKAIRDSYGSHKWRGIKKEFGILGYVRAFDITYGCEGWHPHFHNLFFCSSSPTAEELAARLFPIYKAKVAAVFPGREASIEAFDARRIVSSNAAGYVAKVFLASYLTKNKKDGSILPFDLLSEVERDDLNPSAECTDAILFPPPAIDFDRSDMNAADLYLEYALAMKGRSRLRYSRGLKSALLRSDVVLPDEDEAGSAVSIPFPVPMLRLFASDPSLVTSFLCSFDSGDYSKAQSLCSMASLFCDNEQERQSLDDFALGLVFMFGALPSDELPDDAIEFEEL